MCWLTVVIVLSSSGCGRLGFDPSEGARDGATDGATADDRASFDADALPEDATSRTDGASQDDGSVKVFPDGPRRIATGLKDACYIDSAGFLFCWGACDNGECGLGSLGPRLTPTRVGDLTWREIGMGRYHACGIQSDFTLWCWGDGSVGAVGLGDTTSPLVPMRVGTNTWTQLSSGRHHNCAIRTDGTLWCWGENDTGQLGLGDTGNRNAPTRVGTEIDWVSVASTGGYQSIARRRAGSVWVWGRNNNGQLGLGDMAHRTSPVELASVTGWAVLSVGRTSMCAIRMDGALSCWGANLLGELGVGDMVDRSVPNRVAAAVDWIDVQPSADQHTCGRRRDGSLACWGRNLEGELGLGDTADRNVPTTVPSSIRWTDVSGGAGFTCALDVAGSLYCWGGNVNGELGTGDTTMRSLPTLVR